MKRLSFRLQITLLSSALAGTALIGFGIVSWLQIYRAKLNRLDAQVINILMRSKIPRKIRSSELAQEQQWKLYSNSIADILGINTKISIGFLILDRMGKELYQSEEISQDPDLYQLSIDQLALTKIPPKPPFSKISKQKIAPPPLPPILITTKFTETGTWRIGTVKFRGVKQAVAIEQQIIRQEMAAISNIFLVSILGLLVLIAVGAWVLSKSAIRPINQLTTDIQHVSVKGLDRRIVLDEVVTEFAELIVVFNQMMERLERSFYQSSRFSADAAHELKTPLTIIQGELERMLHQVAPGSIIQQRLSNLLDQTIHLGSIMRKLLLLSLADAGQMSLYLEEFDLSELLWQILEDMEILAPQLHLKTNITEKFMIKGDRDLLMQVFQNLLSNAIKYNIADGWIEVITKRNKSTIQVTINNSSKNIPISDQDRLFERFYRGSPAHTNKIKGTGLGLNLAREIVRAHQGDLFLNSSSDNETSFSLNLPSLKQDKGQNIVNDYQGS